MKKTIKLISIIAIFILIATACFMFTACKKNENDNNDATETETKQVITFDSLKGKKIACIGKEAVPGMVFRYVMNSNGLTIIEEGTPDASKNEVFVQYVSDGSLAGVALAKGEVDYAVVGEPAATGISVKQSLTSEMNIQSEYAKIADNGSNSYPQAGLFVKTELANDADFMDALFAALSASKTWVSGNKDSVTAFADENLYEGASFPGAAIDRCAINVEKLTDAKKDQIITFLSAIMPAKNWEENRAKLFDTTGNASSGTNDLRITAPEGTPALALLRLFTDNKTIAGHTMNYEIVTPTTIASEMVADKSDIVIMPINAGANQIVSNNKGYKLVSVAVDGSLFMIGK